MMVFPSHDRGGGFKKLQKYKIIFQFGYGAIAAYILGAPLYLIPAASILFWLGEKPSWRQFFNELSGLEPEQDYLFMRGMLRGMVWSIPAILTIPEYIYYNSYSMIGFIAMTIVFPVSAYIGYRWLHFKDQHQATELIRPLLFGVALYPWSLI